MINVAIVEDDKNTQELLKSYFDAYEKKEGQSFNIVCFDNALMLFAQYKGTFDLVLMDIEMPGMNGMEAAKKLRGIDKYVTLIFVTNMAQFAVEGYTVDAFDYIVKPVSVYDFSLKLERAVEKIKKYNNVKIKINVDYAVKLLTPFELKYVEVTGHKLIYHTTTENYTTTGTMRTVEEELKNAGFAKCNNCYLVNLRFVKGIMGQTVSLGDEELQMSFPKRKEFVRALNDYLGGGGK